MRSGRIWQLNETRRRWAGLNPSWRGWQKAIREQNCNHINPSFAAFTPRWKGSNEK
jgi:hypothetical protein